MCIKIGGWVRFEAAYGVNGSSTNVQNGMVNNRTTNDLWYRVRGYITADARDQTEYGTVRGYLAVGISTNDFFDPNQTFNANRAFIQWAGFTFGRAQSFFDFFSQAAIGYLGFTPNSDTGDGGWEVLAYTAQLGNGFSASLSAETRRTTQIVGGGIVAGNPSVFNGAFFVPGLAIAPNAGTINGGGAGVGFTQASLGGIGYGGWDTPDIVGNLRVDQAWGSAAIQNPNNNWWIQSGLGTAYGVLSDGVYGGSALTPITAPATNINLTTAWGVNAGYEHFWSPRWRTSLYGGYTSVSYNGQANAILCSLQGAGTGAGALALAQPGCDNNWTSWWIGSRTQWNVTKDFYMGLDVAYLKFDGMSTTSGFVTGTAITPAATTNLKSVGNEDIWMARFRVHRDFYP
jgi:hypothetical protein